MKVLSVKFSKPYTQAAQDAGVEWCFVITTDEKLAHGHAGIGGELRLTAEGWQARHFESTPWQAAAKDRRTAIENAMPAIIEAVAKHKVENENKEIKQREEWQASQKLAAEQKLLHDAAPEMYALLELAVKYLDHPEVKAMNFALPTGPVVERIEKLLAKAKVQA